MLTEQIKREFSELLSHSWRENERGDGMPMISCFYCGESRTAGIAGFGPMFGPMFSHEQTNWEYCREASITEARRMNTATTKPYKHNPFVYVKNEKYKQLLST